MVLRHNDLEYWDNNFSCNGRVNKIFGYDINNLSLFDILEVGPSSGYTSCEIMQNFPGSKLTGIDIDDSVIKQARTNCPDGEFIQGDGYHLNRYFPKDSFDGIFFMNNLAYVVNKMEDRSVKRILTNASEILREGGNIIIGIGGAGKYAAHCIFQVEDQSFYLVDFRSEKKILFNRYITPFVRATKAIVCNEYRMVKSKYEFKFPQQATSYAFDKQRVIQNDRSRS